MKYAVGEQIGEYLITGHLGSGATGDVFRVEHSITRRVEAVKVFHASSVNPERAERILREAMLQAKLNHPNITAVHTAFWSGGDLLLVMEYVEGNSLRQILEDGAVSPTNALSYARQILLALGHAHQNGVMHRDISPANILVTRLGRVKLTDFGLAKQPGDRRITQSGKMMGSVYYTSPEQIRSSADVDFRADLYSTGVVLYEMFTGRKPFDADSPFDLMLAHAEEKVVPPSQWQPGLAPNIDSAILRALEKDPLNRFASASEFIAALEVPSASLPGLPAHVWAGAAFLVVAGVFTAIGLTRSQPPVASSPSTGTPIFVEPSPLESSIPPAIEPPQPVPEPLPVPVRIVRKAPVAAAARQNPEVPKQPAVARVVGAEPPTPVYRPTPQEVPALSAPVQQPLPKAVTPAQPDPNPETRPDTQPDERKVVQQPEEPQKPNRGFWPNVRQRINIFRRRQ